MRRSTALFTVAALAVGAMTLPNSAFAQQETRDQTGTTGARDSGRTAEQRGARQQARVKAIQDLFGRATDAAVSPDGINQLEGLVATPAEAGATSGREGEQGAARTPGATGEEHQTTGSSERSRTSGEAGTAGQGDTSARGRAQAEGRTERERAGERGNFDSAQLNKIVEQIRQQWQQKYHQDFSLSQQNQALVYADITAADIGAPEARPAGSEIRGSRSGSRSESNNSTESNTRSDSSNQTNSGAEAGGTARRAGERMRREPITVNVPAVAGTEALQVRVIREGREDWKFASMRPVDSQMLGRAIESHLKMVQDNQSAWPQDVNQGYRLVTQHVLMAIDEATGENATGQQAQPAGERQRGTRSGASESNAPAGTTGR